MKTCALGGKIFFLLFFSLLLSQQNSIAQLTGVKTIPGNYTTIEAAITDLNTLGVGPGGVTFNVAANHTETFSTATAGRIFATGTAANPIVFQKSGAGANPLITSALSGTGTYDGIIVLAGTDYITFDGISLLQNPAADTGGVAKMEWGYALLKRNSTAPSDGCQFVTIKNASITMENQNPLSIGIYSTHRAYDGTFIAPTDSMDATRNVKIYSNYITDVICGIRFLGNSAQLDKYNEIGVDGGNSIIGYGGTASIAYGIEIDYQNFVKIANNICVGDGGGSLYGIRSGSGTNCNGDFYGNNIKLVSTSTSIIYSLVIALGSGGVDNSINIYNNTIDTSSQTNSTSNSWWAIYLLGSPKNANIYGNIVRNIDKMGGPLHCLYISASPQNLNIYDNHFYNCHTGGTMYGINVSATGTTLNIHRNTLNNLYNPAAATGTAVYGINVTAGLNTYIYNNFISDLRAPSANNADAIRGISISNTTAGTSTGIYHNSIYLNATSTGGTFGTSGIYTAGSSTATNGATDIRDNIVINKSTANGTGKTAAYRRSSTLIANFAAADNNCYYAGVPGPGNVIFYDGTNFDETLAAYKTRVAPKEAASITEDVPFVNNTTTPYNLHVRTDVITQTEAGGTPVATPIAITTDFDNDTRNAVTPDIGADEFDGLGGDLTPPQIDYTALTHTTSTSNRTLSGVSIVDGSGVNVTSGTAPRVYFKRMSDNNTFVDNTSATNGWKWVQTAGTTSPFDFTINYSLLFDGSGAEPGDTIQYFIVAQDLAAVPNVGMLSGTFAGVPASVNLTAAAFPVTGTINSYRIQYILNGAITVGTGGNYNTLTGQTGLFNIMNENIVAGNLTVQIISNLAEPGTFGLDPWVESGAGNYSVIIQPNSAVMRTISGSSANGLIRLNGSDRVTIDGRYNGSGNYLFIQNTSTASSTAAIHVASLGAGAGASDITIRNCDIKAGTDSSSSTMGIFFGGTSVSTSGSGADFQNVLITENNISKCAYGIYVHGLSNTSLATNLTISKNIVGSDNVNDYVTYYGINIQSAAAPVVSENRVYNMIFSSSRHGIWFGSNVNNALVSRNKVHSMNQTGTTGYNSYAIHFSSGTGCIDNVIENNMVYDINTYGNTSLWLNGIRIIGGSNYKIYYNTVSISGTFGNTAADLPSACLAITTASTNMDIRDNIFSNTRQGTTPKNYAVYSLNTTTFLSMDYNDYWTTGSVMGYYGADIASFADWKTTIGRDTSSISGNPMFISDLDPHIQTGAGSPVSNIGVSLAGITSDIDGDLRNSPPDIGADEFSDNPTTFQLTVNVASGWNMVSIPGLLPTNQNVTTWWPGKDPAASVFKFQSGYQPVTVASPGQGYWMKNTANQTYNTGDEWPAGGINIVTHDPIPGLTGWNMIGGYEQTVNTANLTTTPPGLITGTVYKYTPGSGYQAATQLVPGYGYWVKLTGAGSINIPSSLAGPAKNVAGASTEGFGKITITDAAQKSYTLYAVNGEADLTQFDLPPYPPQGMFDVRYSSQRYAEKISTSQTIEMMGVQYPVKVKAEETSIIISDETGKEIARLKAGEEVSVTTTGKLFVSENVIPAVYSLEQNYPNPFNPGTTIQFSIPEDVQNVKLIVYSALGEKVAELVNTGLTAGIYKYNWNASNIASGLYIYQVVTEKFVSTKKMMLLK